jgi:hypothetical protein
MDTSNYQEEIQKAANVTTQSMAQISRALLGGGAAFDRLRQSLN